MLTEGQVKFFSPQNTAGVSQEKGVEVMSQTNAVNGDQVLNIKKETVIKPLNDVIQMSLALTCQSVLKNVTDIMVFVLMFTVSGSEMGAILLVSGIDEGLQDVIHFLIGLPPLLSHLEEDVLDLSVSSVSFPKERG